MSSHAHTHQAMPLKIYLLVGAALLALTAVTIWAAGQDFGEWNTVVALAIATVKALLVAFFFMHLYYDNKFYFFVLVMGVLMLALFIGFSMIDTQRRGDLYREVAMPINPQAVLYRSDADSLQAAADTSAAATTAADTSAAAAADTSAAGAPAH